MSEDSSSDAPIRVMAAVVRRGDRYLVCQRPLDKRHGGLLEFPGGKCNPGESDADAVARELREELGVVVARVEPAVVEIADPGSPYVIAFVPVEISGEPIAHEHITLLWATLDQINRLPLAPSDRRFAMAARDERRNSDPVRVAWQRYRESAEPLGTYRIQRQALIAANGGDGGISIVGLLHGNPVHWNRLPEVVAACRPPLRLVIDVACELLLANGAAFDGGAPLYLEGFLGSSGQEVPATYLIPGIGTWLRNPSDVRVAIQHLGAALGEWRVTGFRTPEGIGEWIPDADSALRPFVPHGRIPRPELTGEFLESARELFRRAATE